MPTRFYLSTDTTGAVAVTGVSPAPGSTTASRVLQLTLPGAAAYTVSAAASSTVDSISTSAAIPGWGWQAITAPVNLNITTGNADIQLSVALARINSSGAVQVQTAFTAEQTATAGVRTFTVPSVSWGTPNSTDRLALVVRLRNTSSGGSRGITTTVGASSFVDAPVEPGLALPVGSGVTLSSGTVTVTKANSTGPALRSAAGAFDPLTYPYLHPALDPTDAQLWYSTSTTPTPSSGASTSVTVALTGLSLTSTSGSPTWPSTPQFAAFATLVPHWVRAQSVWRPVQRLQFMRAVSLLATDVTIAPTGLALTVQQGSAANFGAQAASFGVRMIPWWQRLAPWRARQRFQLQRATEGVTTAVNVYATGLSLSSALGTPTLTGTTGTAVGTTGKALAYWQFAPAWRPRQRVQVAPAFTTAPTPGQVTLTGQALTLTSGTVSVVGNRTVAVTGAALAVTAGVVSNASLRAVGVTGAALTLARGAVVVTTARVATPTGLTLTGTLGVVAVAYARTVLLTGQTLTTAVGTARNTRVVTVTVTGTALTSALGPATARTQRTVSCTGLQMGSAAGVALARFPVQAPQVVGMVVTAGTTTPLAYATVPSVVGAASLYGPFDADQWFGGGS